MNLSKALPHSHEFISHPIRRVFDVMVAPNLYGDILSCVH